MINGIIPINKPAGWTSFDVVNKIKHLSKCKVGHLGTLDPMAEGVLLVTINKATKLFDLMQQKSKEYVAKFKFGELTDTLDAMGKQIDTSGNIPTKQQILDVLPKFKGKISQIPPNYSAKSVNGKRAYDLARKGEDFCLPAKVVTIYSIDFIDYNKAELTIKIVCSSGTYIRAIGRDIAAKLNTFATMSELTRTKIDNFSLSDCVDISTLTSQNVLDKIVPISKVLNYPTLNLDKQSTAKILNGQTINLAKDDGLYFLLDGFSEVAIIKIVNNLAKMQIFLG